MLEGRTCIGGYGRRSAVVVCRLATVLNLGLFEDSFSFPVIRDGALPSLQAGRYQLTCCRQSKGPDDMTNKSWFVMSLWLP